MKLGILVGTRPEIIKMSPLIRRALTLNYVELVLIHSNQHYSESMDGIFFRELGLPEPHFNLSVGRDIHSNQIGNIMIKLEPVLKEQNIDVLLVQGDTNTVAAGALVASKLGIKLGHVEAGLRSYDKSMPEEGNRIVTDHLSDFLFAVTPTQVEILKGEGINQKKIIKVGNTIVDAVFENREIANKHSSILRTLNLEAKNYTLFTAHRAGNVDKPESLKETLEILSEIKGVVCWPIHLRTKKNLELFNLKLPSHVVTCEPLGYFDFLTLESNARLIVTDSGGLQEEACILGIPCITIRENTERPETVQVGANKLVGRDITKFRKALNSIGTTWKNPFGNGSTSDKILNVVLDDFGLAPISLPEEKKDHIVVIGMGYMGIPTALLFATHGYRVTGVDHNETKVNLLNSGKLPFTEEGIDNLLIKALEKDKFIASATPVEGDIFIVAVPTPQRDKKCDLSYVVSAVESLIPILKSGNILIIESTIKPGSCDNIIAPILKEAALDIELVHCPERAIPGNTLYELVHNDRIIGCNTEPGQRRTKELYESFVKGEVFTSSVINAECAKLIENTYRDVNIALANELSIISHDLGFDAKETIKLANRHPRVNVLNPGAGVGGHCIPIDPWFLTEDSDKARLIMAARAVNDYKPVWCVEQLLESKKVTKDSNVVLMGLAYKPDVDDARETPAEKIFDELKKREINVKVFDPYVKMWQEPVISWDEASRWGDVFLIVTNHRVFQESKYQSKRPILLG